MKIAVTGATGFIARHLLDLLAARGHQAICISRAAHPGARLSESWVTWEQLDREPERLEGVDALVNLAGESINQRWTEKAKQRILTSRLQATRQVAELVRRMKVKPKVVLNGSGVAVYGTSETDVFTEESVTQDSDFLADMARQWETAADEIAETRLVKLRTGVVLGNGGGALPLMALPYRLFAGGKIGSGRQWLSWIHIADMVNLIIFCIEHEDINGPVNCVAPNPVTNKEFGRAVGQVLRRPHWLPAPAAALRLALGEMSLLLLQGQQVLPQRLLAHGFRFRFPDLEEALQDLLVKRKQDLQ